MLDMSFVEARRARGIVNRDRKERTGDGADHQQDHDLQGACGASLHVHVQPIHGHGACESSTGASALFSTAPQKMY